MSHRIFDPEKEYWYAVVTGPLKLKPITTATPILLATLLYFLKHTGFNAVYHYILLDAAFSILFLPAVWQGGVTLTGAYIAFNALWTIGMWRLANYLCPFLINRI